MKKNLNEEISRIKGMMGMIMNESFDSPEGPSETAKQIASTIISDVTKRPIGKYIIFDDYSFNSGEAMISFGDEDGNYITYYMDTDVSKHSSFTPGRNYMSNGDPGYPDEYTDAEYDLAVVKLEVGDGRGLVYSGKDFTNIMDVQLSDGSTMGDKVYEHFSEDIGQWESEYDSEPDYDDYRDDY